MTTLPRSPPTGYATWLETLKSRIRAARQKAALAVNQELIALYWQIGKGILERQARRGWGAKIVERLAQDLGADFPEMKGFSPRNLKYMRAFAEAWPDFTIVQQLVAQLPWGHNLVLLTKLKNQPARLAYAKSAIEHGWSRNVLNIQIELQSVEREGRAVTNFEQRLPKPHSDLARESLNDPYKFDFLSLGKEAGERAIEDALVQHVTRFLVELGTGFAYVGRQVPLEVDDESFYIDLLFYHVRLHCYVVIELKAGMFKPEHLGQLNFYLSAIDAQMKQPEDNPAIGLLLCKSRSRVVAEYALRGVNKPIGVAEYQLVKSLPKKLRVAFPTIKEIEAELTAGKSGGADGVVANKVLTRPRARVIFPKRKHHP